MNTSRKIIITILAIVVITGAVAYSIKKGQQSHPKNASAITIGAIMPLTGQISVLGENMRNGMELARQTLVDSGQAKDLKVIYEDACDGKTTTNAVQKLINADRVNIIGSGFCLFGLDAVVPTTEQSKVVLFNTAANPDSVLNKKYVFSTNFNIRDDATKMADYAYGTLGAKRVSMIYLDTSFGHSYYDNFKARFTQLGGTMTVSEAETPDAQDFRTDITKIKSEKPDAVIIIHFGISLGNAVKQTRELGLNVPLMGDYEAEDPTVIQYAGKAAEGMVISSSEPSVETANVKDFLSRYKAAYGKDADVLAANAYDALMLQVSAYQKCSGDTECIANYLKNVKSYDGVSGNITVNPSDHSVTKPTVYKVVKNGAFVELSR